MGDINGDGEGLDPGARARVRARFSVRYAGRIGLQGELW